MFRFDWPMFGGSVKAFIELSGRSYRDIESELGISKSTLSRVTRGRPINTDALVTLCHWLEVDPLNYASTEPPHDH